MPSDNFCLPVCVCGDHSYSRAVRLTDKGVRATFVVYCHDLKLGSWQPLQGRSHVAGPDAPPGSVFQLDDVALVVVCNQHSWQRLVTMALSLQRLPVRDAGILRSSLSVTNTCSSLRGLACALHQLQETQVRLHVVRANVPAMKVGRRHVVAIVFGALVHNAAGYELFITLVQLGNGGHSTISRAVRAHRSRPSFGCITGSLSVTPIAESCACVPTTLPRYV